MKSLFNCVGIIVFAILLSIISYVIPSSWIQPILPWDLGQPIVNAMTTGEWQETFETLPIGEWPGNFTCTVCSGYVDNATSFEGSNSFRFYARNSCEESDAERVLGVSLPFEVELAMVASPHSGCHGRALLIRPTTSECYYCGPADVYISNNMIYTNHGLMLGYIYGWRQIKIRYEKPDNDHLHMTYWLDGEFIGSESIPDTSIFDKISFFSGDGTAWIDDIKVSPVEPIPEIIKEIEINQGLGRTFGNYVAGKDTVIRVYLNSPLKSDAQQQFVYVLHNGTPIATLYPIPTQYPDTTLTFICPTRDACGNWQAGNYTFDVNITGAYKQKTATFYDRRAIHLLGIPVRIKGNIEPDPAWKDADWFLRQVYPVSLENVIFDIYHESIDATDLTLSINCSENNGKLDGKCVLYNRLRAYEDPKCGETGHQYCYDGIIGFLPRITDDPTWLGQSFVGTHLALVVIDPALLNNYPATLAHEVGHKFNLGDEYAGGIFNCGTNPPPSYYIGHNNMQCGGSSSSSWPGAEIGSLVSSLWNPYDVFKHTALGNKLSFMGSADLSQAEYWISSNIHKHLFETFSMPALLGFSPTSPVPSLRVSGIIWTDDSIFIDPWYQIDQEMMSPATGQYSIEAIDSSSQILVTQGFDVSFIALSNPPIDTDYGTFQTTMAFPASATAFRIKHGTTILAVVPVSPHPPTVTIDTPKPGEDTITWQANDLDGTALYHTVQYSNNGDNWMTLAGGITETQLTTNFDHLPGGNYTQLRIITTDGINTTEATSGYFSVPVKPPNATIFYPNTNARLPYKGNTTLYGRAYDMQDKTINKNTSLIWYSNKDGLIGYGGLVNLSTLSLGQHVITFTVTNSQGLTDTAQVTVNVGYYIYLPVTQRK